MKNNFILLLVGKSGSGKSFIADCLEELYGWTSIQSYTTRPKRSEDEKGHIFVSEAEVPSRINMVAYTEFCGNKYWATKEQVEENDIYIIDPKGVEEFTEKYKGNKKVIVCYIDCDIDMRFKRMLSRRDKHYNALVRIENDGIEFNGFYDNFQGYKCYIDNSSIEIKDLLFNLKFIKNQTMLAMVNESKKSE